MKKRNRFYLCALVAAGVVCAVGCGNQKPNADAAVAVESAESDVKAEVTDSKSAEKVYSMTRHNDAGEYGSEYDNIYTLIIHDDTNATYQDETVYAPNYRNIAVYDGTYTMTETGIRFKFVPQTDIGEEMAYIFELDGDKLIDVITDRAGQSALAGSYTCSTAEYGDVVLNISKSGKAILTIDNKDYDASLDMLGDRWNLMAYDMDTDFNIDWYVDFGDGTFTYELFSFADYTKYAGKCDINGDLGVISLDLSENGDATTSIKLDGEMIEFTGTYYVDDQLERLTSVDLYSESGYSLSLYLEDIGEELLNYSGTVNRPLGAG